MSDLEKEYYESNEFWKEGMVEDEANLLRLKETINLIPKGTKNLADFGCGNGIFARMLATSRPEIDTLSIDRSETALKYVKTKKLLSGLFDVPLADNSFDCTNCLQVLEHIPVNEYEGSLHELSRISDKYIIISVPYNEDISKEVTQCPQCKSIFNVELHLRSYTDSDIEKLFSKDGFRLINEKKVFKKNMSYWGTGTYVTFRNLFSGNKGMFKSPVCVVCGYKNKDFNISSGGNAESAESSQASAKSYLKKFWPKKYVTAAWVIGVYQKN